MEKKSTKQLIDDFDYLANAASRTDCTGLIPSLPQNEAELESYNDIVQYMTPTAQSTHVPPESNSLEKKPAPSYKNKAST